jgi:uncharacterized protein YdhG (YjbR/CyaY superfamily)
MKSDMPEYNDIDSYIKCFPVDTQKILNKLRAAIQEAAPEAKEKISYGIPTFTLNGNLVHFAAYKNHVGFYPGAIGIKAFSEELSAYEGGKGTVRFPLDKPIPYDLITEIVKFRVIQNSEKVKSKKKSS